MKNLKISTKLLIMGLVIGFIPMAIIGGFASFKTRNTISNQSFNQLSSIRDIKKDQLEDFFQERKNDMHILLETISIFKQNTFQKYQAIQKYEQNQLENYFEQHLHNIKVLSTNSILAKFIAEIELQVHEEIKPDTISKYKTLFGTELQKYQQSYDYDDMLIIAKDGDVVYSVKERTDLQQNILQGKLKNTHLQQAFQKGLNRITIQDFAPYFPANNQYTAFITAPIFNANELVGVLVFSLLPATINNIVNQDEISETYLIGQWNEKISYRSDGENFKIGTKIAGIDIEQALDNKSGVEIKLDKLGNPTIIAYAPLKILDLNWGIITTVQLEQALAIKLIDEQEDFFTKYIRQYDYHDLLIIHPQGKIFYTIKHESDYLTNIITGQYANSNLGKLIQDVIQTKVVGISDFAPYVPNNNKPSAFIAQPLIHNDNIELIVALKINDKVTNEIMQQRSGMGETGETYLVGSDNLMRSNSFLDPENYTISASFANPTINNVKTQSVQLALTGNIGQNFIKDYRDSWVLSAYTPIKVGNTTWALIAEIDKSEAFANLNKLEWLIISAIILVGLITLIFINKATKALTIPLSAINENMKTLALGKVVADEIKYHKNDEIGELVTSTLTLKVSMETSIAQANAIAAGNYEQEVKLLSEQDELGQALIDMTTILRTTTIKNLQEDWLKAGQAQLNKLTSGDQDINELTKNIITFLTTYVEATVGLLYLLQNPNLQLTASYAYIANEGTPNKFAIGEGLVGQAALEQKVLFRHHSVTEYTNIIQSGLAITVPSYVIILPFLYEKDVKGIVEIGASQELSEIQITFLQQAMSNIGIIVNTANSRNQMKVLLQQSQQQAEELQLKHKEMQQTNEELQSQSEELQSQSEELKTQQEELRQTNEILEERTRGLEQQQTETQEKNQILEVNRVEMEKAQQAIILKAEELELASKYKSEFLANMSHELRTPLNSLLILAQLLADNKPGTLNEKQIEYAKTINSAGKDLLNLINDILDLSKVEAGKIEVLLENVELPELLTTIKQKFLPIADNKNLEFSVNIDSNINSTLRTDSQRLTQVINNLLSNAFKFTSKGSITITIKKPTEISTNIGASANQLELNKTIAISVIDTGIGIPKDKQQAIFEAFQQADGSTSRRFGGTGLGLSISRQLAHLLGGELTLTSNNNGSIFTLYLPNTVPIANSPVAEIPDEFLLENGLPKLKPIPDDRDNLQLNDKSILFVEDDRKFSKILMELATDKKFKYLLAEDGMTGVQLAEQYKPSAIVLDIGLPELNGWSVMERLKDNPNTRHIPVHFISGTDQSIDAKKMGAIGYLLKPVSMEKLTNAFKQIEYFLTRTVKNLLIVTDIDAHKQKIIELVNEDGIQIQQEIMIKPAFHNLQTTSYDCIILDIDIEQGSGSELLEMMQQDGTHCQTPIIVYADRDLTTEEEGLLMRCSDEIPIKSVSSYARLLDETTLFLHQIEAKLPADKRDMLHMVHDKEAILKNKKVLIVDDDMRNIYALATVLEECDMEVICSVNGQECLNKMNQHDDIAIILMDIMMPKMDGYTAMQEIRKQPKYRKLPIIALTAKVMKDDKAKCIEAGANDYLAKPVDADKLMSLMRVWLYR